METFFYIGKVGFPLWHFLFRLFQMVRTTEDFSVARTNIVGNIILSPAIWLRVPSKYTSKRSQSRKNLTCKEGARIDCHSTKHWYYTNTSLVKCECENVSERKASMSECKVLLTHASLRAEVHASFHSSCLTFAYAYSADLLSAYSHTLVLNQSINDIKTKPKSSAHLDRFIGFSCLRWPHFQMISNCFAISLFLPLILISQRYGNVLVSTRFSCVHLLSIFCSSCKPFVGVLRLSAHPLTHFGRR